MNRGVKKILKKLDEYGFELYNQYSDENNNHYFMIDDMVLCYDDNDGILSIAFKASIKPEQAANNTLILKEIDGIKDFEIMESFIYKGKEILSGDDAHKYVEKVHGNKEIGKYISKQNQIQMLLYSKKHGNC